MTIQKLYEYAFDGILEQEERRGKLCNKFRKNGEFEKLKVQQKILSQLLKDEKEIVATLKAIRGENE